MCHQLKQPTPLKELAPDAPDGLVAVVERLMKKAPAERYARCPRGGRRVAAVRIREADDGTGASRERGVPESTPTAGRRSGTERPARPLHPRRRPAVPFPLFRPKGPVRPQRSWLHTIGAC